MSSFEQTFGTRSKVWHGTAKKTTGNLTKSDLMMNKHGRIVSRKMHNTAKRENRLVKAGFLTKKGHFGFIKKGKNTRGRHTRGKHTKGKSNKMRGGTGSAVGKGVQSFAAVGGRRTRSSRKMKGGMVTLNPSTF